MGSEAAIPMNRSLIHLGSKVKMQYGAERKQEILDCAYARFHR